MIINGGSRSNGAFFAQHLMRSDQNERVTVTGIRGFAYAEDVTSAFRELHDLADGTRCKNYFYHANINTRADERLTPEQWAQAADRLESELHLEGQPRFVVEHDKDGRVHQHVVWGRIDADSMTAIPDGHNYRRHELVATELEQDFGHEATERALTRDKDTTPRPEPRPADWESFRAAESKIDPQAMKAELTDLWKTADSGPAFAAALAERGYRLARGDRRDFCIVDQAGDEHSLARRLSGVKAAEVRARMEGVDRDALPTVEEARALARNRPEEAGGAPTDATPQFGPETSLGAAQGPVAATPSQWPTSPFDRAMAERMAEAQADLDFRPARREEPEPPSFENVMQRTLQEARADANAAETDDASGRWERFSAWLSTMREHVTGLGQQAREYWSGYFGGREAEEQTLSPNSKEPVNTIYTAGAEIKPMRASDNGPELG